jgi:hypothetical protein
MSCSSSLLNNWALLLCRLSILCYTSCVLVRSADVHCAWLLADSFLSNYRDIAIRKVDLLQILWKARATYVWCTLFTFLVDSGLWSLQHHATNSWALLVPLHWIGLLYVICQSSPISLHYLLPESTVVLNKECFRLGRAVPGTHSQEWNTVSKSV